MSGRRRRNLDWLEEAEAEEAAEEQAAEQPETPGVAVVPRALLEQIAADRSQPASARVQAAKALHDMGVTEEDPQANALSAWAHSLSGEDLDRELAGFFNPGYQPDGDEAHIEEEVERRMASTRKAIERRLRRLRKGGDERPEPVERAEPTGREARADVPPDDERAKATDLPDVEGSAVVVAESRTTRLIRIDTGEEIDPTTAVGASKFDRHLIREQAARERRAALPPGQRQHVPPGVDPRAAARAWPTRRA